MATYSKPPARRPQEINKNLGHDMTMHCFVQPACPTKFTSNDQHHIKGLNAEAIAQVFLPAPSWILNPEYSPLRQHQDDDFPGIFFSLNISIYNQHISPDEWTESWFFMNGRVHPYALTWEVEQIDGSEADIGNVVNYTIPALIVRDQQYQPVMPRTFASFDRFPLIPPTVTFLGPILGSGSSLLKSALLPGLDNEQLRCCGFVNLSTYLTPPDVNKTPFGGYHPFQVFVIFPIHCQPWETLCRKMSNRPESAFQATSTLMCTGKVAGLLDHNVMVYPPEMDHDYVFIIVPDSWTFQAAAANATATGAPTASVLPLTPAEKPSLMNAKMKFTTPTKRRRLTTPPISSSLSQDIVPESMPETPSKKPQEMHTTMGNVPVSTDSSASLSTTAEVSDDVDELQITLPKSTASMSVGPGTRRTRHLKKN